ncbi:hypothetical protein [Paenarthrobacter sp. NPDC057981]|uniref:hypothetical protein n=1 Tax=Paenarthrobacter sp. NPDC057981 TaxID=3346297 RepID=UPI0036DD44C9
MPKVSDPNLAVDLTRSLATVAGEELQRKFMPSVEAAIEVIRQASASVGGDENFRVTSIKATEKPIEDYDGEAQIYFCFWMFGYQYCVVADCDEVKG